MILDERGAAKALKEAWKEGYIISPGREMMNIYTAKWAVVAPVRMLPLQVSQALVEHVGHIPVDPEKVKKGEVNQTVMNDDVDWRAEQIERIRQRSTLMRKLPVIYKGKWQLYYTEKTEKMQVFAFDQELLGIISEESYCDTYVTLDGLGLWSENTQMVTIAPAKFSLADQKAINRIAAIFAEEKVSQEEVENVCLFDDLEDDDE